MPKLVEVDEEQLLRDRNLRATVAQIMANPQARELVEQAHKLVNPEAKTPTLDAKKVVTEPLSAVEKKIDDFIKAQNEANQKRDDEAKLARLTADRDAGLARLRQQGWNDDGVKAVEKIMEEKGILDPEIAAAYFEKLHPPATPVAPGGTGSWGFLDGLNAAEPDVDLKKLVESKGEDNALVHKMAIDALNEVRGSRR